MRTFHRATSALADEPLINLTPMIDVVFVLLIVFILAAPILEIDQVQLASSSLKVETRAAASAGADVTIHVRQDNSVLFNLRPISLPQLEEELVRARVRHPSAQPQVFHDRRAQFGTYQAIKNAVEAAGFSEMDVILQPG